MSFLSYLINGISLGSVYAIIALGYTMVYGIAKMLNFAHGDIIMVGAFSAFTVISTLGMPPVLGVLASVIVCTLLGVTIERIAYKPLRGASPLAVTIDPKEGCRNGNPLVECNGPRLFRGRLRNVMARRLNGYGKIEKVERCCTYEFSVLFNQWH